jgi:hypothetical protein
MTSCYKVYDPSVDTVQKVLVVDSRITNVTDVYHVVLTYAGPFNSNKSAAPVSAANVYVTDNLGNSYKFTESDKGDYVSDSLKFTGQPGHIYQLHIVTMEGTEYESDPQRLFPEVKPDSVYAEFNTKEILSGNTGPIVNTHGADILIDIYNLTDTLPRFRFTADLVTQYFYLVCPIYQKCDEYYCWMTDNANTSLNLTDDKYSQGSASVKKHAVCFLVDNLYCSAQAYVKRYLQENSTFYAEPTIDYRTFMIDNRILYLNTYSLNNESYLYYKRLDQQVQSDGKLFDPIAVQLNGNIKCISDPEKKTIGFFEASSVSYSAYSVDFMKLKNSQPSVIKIPYILPPEIKGCNINRVPSFWIFK